MKAPLDHLSPYLRRGQRFLGVDYPIICGAMSRISERNLVSGVANSGGFGVLAAGSLSGEALRDEIKATASMTSQPFGVNLILHNPFFSEQFKVALEEEAEFLVFAGAIPDGPLIRTAKEEGKKTMCFAPSLPVANILVEQGADALIIEGSEAGGHVGSNTTLTLIQEILLQFQEVPVFVAGGIATGEIMATCFLLGAAGVQIGTRFAISEESTAHPRFKQAYLRAKIHHTDVYNPSPTRRPGHGIRCIKNAACTAFAEHAERLQHKIQQEAMPSIQAEEEMERFWSGRLRDAVVYGDVNTGALMSGESVAFVRRIEKVETILNNLLEDANHFLYKIRQPPSFI